MRRAKSQKESRAAANTRKVLEKARTRDSLQALAKLAEVVDGRYRIVNQPPIVVPLRELAATYGISPDDVERVIRHQHLVSR